MRTGERTPREGPFPVRVWLELDLDAQPIEGTLGPPGGPPAAFSGWLGLTEALERFRPVRESLDGDEVG